MRKSGKRRYHDGTTASAIGPCSVVSSSELKGWLPLFRFCVLTTNSILNASVNKERWVVKQVPEISLITVNKQREPWISFYWHWGQRERSLMYSHGKNPNGSKVPLNNPTASKVTITFTCDIFGDLKKTLIKVVFKSLWSWYLEIQLSVCDTAENITRNNLVLYPVYLFMDLNSVFGLIIIQSQLFDGFVRWTSHWTFLIFFNLIFKWEAWTLYGTPVRCG